MAFTPLDKNSSFEDMVNLLNTIPVNPKKGATGNAQPSQVLSGITFSNIDNIDLVGTMANRGSVGTQTLTTQNGQYTIPAGYHNGSGIVKATFPVKTTISSTITTQNGTVSIPAGYYGTAGSVKATFANLIAGNVKSGINIGGIVGSYQGDGKKFAEGNSVGTSSTLSVSNLSFSPDFIWVQGNKSHSNGTTQFISTASYFTQAVRDEYGTAGYLQQKGCNTGWLLEYDTAGNIVDDYYVPYYMYNLSWSTSSSGFTLTHNGFFASARCQRIQWFALKLV